MTNEDGTFLTLNVVSAGGGHGSTTIAGMIAAATGRAAGSSDIDEFAWMFGADVVVVSDDLPEVIDCGTDWPRHLGRAVAVIRGPSVLGLRRLVREHRSVAVVVCIVEPWRTLGRSDLVVAFEGPAIIEVPWSERIARLADAGLLGSKLAGLSEFSELFEWIDSIWPDADRRAIA